jgi:non-homologous end joining protein Ku
MLKSVCTEKSTSKGLHHPIFKSLVSAKKIVFPAVAHSAVQFSNLNSSANSKQNSKKISKLTGAQIGSIDEYKKREEKNLTLRSL